MSVRGKPAKGGLLEACMRSSTESTTPAASASAGGCVLARGRVGEAWARPGRGSGRGLGEGLDDRVIGVDQVDGADGSDEAAGERRGAEGAIEEGGETGETGEACVRR